MKAKVYGGRIGAQGENGRAQCRALVKAMSKSEAREILREVASPRTSTGELRDYWSITGNRKELDAMHGQPVGTVMVDLSANQVGTYTVLGRSAEGQRMADLMVKMAGLNNDDAPAPYVR